MNSFVCYLQQCAKTILVGIAALVLLKCLICPNTFDIIILVGLLLVLMSWICK